MTHLSMILFQKHLCYTYFKFQMHWEILQHIHRHTVEKGRWSRFKLTPSLERPNEGTSIRHAIGIWLNTANSTNPVQFRDGCHLTHCNEMCPEEITFAQDESFLWQFGFEVFIYSLVTLVTLICFIIKTVFSVWHWWLLHKQNQFLHRARDAEKANATYQFPECEDKLKISIACLDLRYSVPFNHKKHKEASAYDVKPLVLPTINADESDGDEENSYDEDEGYEETTDEPVNDGIATSYGQLDNMESENSQIFNGAFPLLPIKEAFVYPEVSDAGLKEKRLKPPQKVKEILKGISLYFNPGQLVAIMGPSGSGKTTFLDLLTGRRKYGNIKGSIFINGHRLDDIRDWYIANTGYVLQLAMPYYEELTVRENLTLAAQMRLSFSMREKFERTEQVMNGTGLQELADIVVGGTVGPGLSGGQKKRLTIALQLLRLPSVIFLDEPTSGLDSASSYELLTYLNKLAGSQRTVIMTIHQPRMEIFHMFTRLIMFCEGKVAYHGTPFKAYEVFITALKAQYLEKGLVLPQLEDKNPADVIMDMLGNSKMREAILRYYEESGDPQAVVEAIKQSQKTITTQKNRCLINMVLGKRREFQDQGSTFVRMAALEARAKLRATIPQLAYLPTIFFSYGFLLGTVYLQTTSALLVVSGFCVYSLASSLFMFPIMHKYYSQAITIYELENSDGIGHCADLVIQGFSRFVFLGPLPVAVCGGILYLLVIMVKSYSLEVYLKVLVVNMALNQTWIALLIFVLCAFPSIAFRLSPVITAITGFASGFFIPRDSMPPWYRWLFFINPNYYGFSSTSYLLLKEFDSNCAGNELECYVSTGDYTLTQFNFNETNPALHVMILLVMTVSYLLLAILAMWIRHSDIRSALRKLHDKLISLEKPTLHLQVGLHQKNKIEVNTPETEMTKLSTASVVHLDVNAENNYRESPSINTSVHGLITDNSSYSKDGEDKVRSSSKKEISDGATEEQQLPQYANSYNIDLNESQLQLEKFLLPSTDMTSRGLESLDSSKLFTKQNSLYREDTGINPTMLFVKHHSSGEILRVSKLARRTKPEYSPYWRNDTCSFRLSTGQSSHRATSAVISTRELRLRQKQLQKRVSLVRKVSKDCSTKILQQALPQKDTYGTLQQATVAYNTRNKSQQNATCNQNLMDCVTTTSDNTKQKQRTEVPTNNKISKLRATTPLLHVPSTDDQPNTTSEDTTLADFIPHMSSEVTSMFAGQYEHRHNEKSFQNNYL